MKKKLAILGITILIIGLSGCVKTMKTTTKNITTLSNTISPTTTSDIVTTLKDYYNPKDNVDPVVLEEIEKSFLFFWETQNSKIGSKAYGLVPDRYDSALDKVKSSASIASVGYGLSAIPIGVEHGYISYEEGEERTYQSLVSLEKLERLMGFYYHFYNLNSGIKNSGSEVSIIDTAIFLNGALTAGKYFGGRCEEISRRIYEDVNWTWYLDKDQNKFYMGYTTKGFSGYWGQYAEQLMIFLLSAGSPTHAVGRSAYTLMKNTSKLSSGSDDYDPFYMTWTGSIFVYQYSHNWFDFEKYVDNSGYSWYTNSVNASRAQYAYAQKEKANYQAFSENSWGLSACDGPDGYSGAYGSGPSTGTHYNDGTVALYAAVSSIVFTEDYSLNALKYYYSNDKLLSKYGLIDSYNLGAKNSYVSVPKATIPQAGWYGKDLIGIDKGNTLMMLENYNSSLVWNIYMDIDYIKNAIEVLGFKKA